jgi:hypothetical protein
MQKTSSDKKTVTYCTVKFTVGWLPGSIGFTEQAKAVLASGLGTDAKVIRGSYAILGASRDSLIQEGAALRRLLTLIRDSYTIPEYTLVASAANDVDSLKPEKIKGSYLIEACKVEEFMARFNEARLQYLAWGKRVAEPANYERIKEADRISLAKDWDIVCSKYPTAAQLADAVTCDIPRIEPFDAAFTLADVAPATAKFLREQAEKRLNASVEGATSELITEFKEMVEAVAKNCGKRIRLLPGLGSARQELRYAEVQQILRHTDDEEVPVGKLLVTVQTASPKPGSPDSFVQTGKPNTLLLTEAEYKELQPYETEEHRALTQSAFENLQWLAQKISAVKTMLGSDKQVNDLTNLADEISTTLGALGGSAAEITKQLKNSSFARTTTKQTFGKFFDRIVAQEIEIKAKNKVARRKIKVGGGEE